MSTQHPRAGIPKKGFRVVGSMYADEGDNAAWRQEDGHAHELDLREFGQGGFNQLESIIKYLIRGRRSMHLSCSAFVFDYKLSISKRELVICNMVFCGKTEEYNLLDMLLGTLVNFCSEQENPLSLSIKDPIPPVKEALKRMWCPWSSAHKDLFLPSDRMLDARGLISEEIKATGCCPSRDMVVRERWYGVDPPKLTDDQILDIMYSISKDYIVSLECLLYRIFNAFKRKFRHGNSFRTDAACVDLCFTPYTDQVVLKKISVRPCLQGLGIGRMIINVILNACIEFQVPRFLVKEAYPSTEAILLNLGGFKVTREYSHGKDYTIELKDMRETLAAFEHREGPIEHDEHSGYFTIDPSLYPTSDELNSQQAVEERCAKRSGTGA